MAGNGRTLGADDARPTAVSMQTGPSIATDDIRIAATARARGYAVPTLNLRDFDRAIGLVVRTLDREKDDGHVEGRLIAPRWPSPVG